MASEYTSTPSVWIHVQPKQHPPTAEDIDLISKLHEFMRAKQLRSMYTICSGAGYYSAIHPTDQAPTINEWLRQQDVHPSDLKD